MLFRTNGLKVDPVWASWLALADCYGGRLRHALGCEEEIRRRCIVNGEPAKRVARSMGLDPHQVVGAVRIFRRRRWSPERLACVVMLDPGMTDEDIAEIFGRSVRWAQVVRRKRKYIKREEPMPRSLVWFDPYLQQHDPSPAEIALRAKDVRENGVPDDSVAKRTGTAKPRRAANGTFVSIGAA